MSRAALSRATADAPVPLSLSALRKRFSARASDQTRDRVSGLLPEIQRRKVLSPRAAAVGRGPVLNLFLARVTLLCFLSAQFRLDEKIDCAVHDCLDVACLGAGPVVLHHLVRLKNIRPNLAAPGHVAFLAVLPIDLGALLVLLDFVEFRLQHFDRQLAVAPLAALGLARDHNSRRDRKTTRLNSSHTVISYAVFCLK